MRRWESTRPITALGSLFVTLAVIRTVLVVAEGRSFIDATVGFVLVGGLGLSILYGGYRISNSDLRPEVYPRIVSWCLGGFGAMLGILLVLQFSPVGGSIDRPLFSAPLATALGSLGGLAVGINEAKAISRAWEAEQRNRELKRTQATLNETVERLEVSNERLEQFAYAASHDLQEPLRMVSSYLRLFEQRYGDDLDDDAKMFLDYAVDGSDRMRAMIDGLLAYSRVDTRGNEFGPVDLDVVVEDTREDLQIMIDESDAEITVDSLPWVRGDGDQLRQVFQNLLDNAITYSDESPRVHVSAERDGSEWVISVRDEGIGIDPKYCDRIFEVFQRLHGADDRAGSGIGLALCERIVERHGGDIWVDSEPGEGSTFYFTLPHVDAETKTEARRRPPADDAGETHIH